MRKTPEFLFREREARVRERNRVADKLARLVRRVDTLGNRLIDLDRRIVTAEIAVREWVAVEVKDEGCPSSLEVVHAGPAEPLS